jgi:hypothetical protein
MQKVTITIPRRRYSAAVRVRSAGRKAKNRGFVEPLVRELAAGEYASLQSVLDEVGRKAQARGLTTEKLDSLLKGA